MTNTSKGTASITIDVQGIVQEIVRLLGEEASQIVSLPQTSCGDLASRILTPETLLRTYSTSEAAEFLGMHASDVTRIPEIELPKHKLGLSRGRNAYTFLDLFCYVHRLPPVDTSALLEAFCRCLEEDAPHVRPLHPKQGSKTRLL